MNRLSRNLTVAALALAIPISAAAAPPAESNQFLIEFKGAVPSNVEAAVSKAGGTLSRDMSELGYMVAVSDDPRFARNLERNKNISSVSQDMVVQWLPEEQGFEPVASGIVAQGLGADPNGAVFGACQWANDQINVSDAWSKGETGQGVKVAVIDSGVDPDHVDLLGKVDIANSVSMISTQTEDNMICDEYSELFFGEKDSESFRDFRHHGTFVAGTIAAHGFATAGVAPDAEILAIKALNCFGDGSFLDVLFSVYYATQVPGVQVINMSLGAYFPKTSGPRSSAGRFLAAMTKAINYANSMGILVVSAAGNDGADLQHDGNWISVPAELGAGIATWAGGIEENLAGYSNHGVNSVKLGAGGGSYDVESSQIPLPGCGLPEGGQYGMVGPCSSTSLFFNCEGGTYILFGGGGTSFSAPMVSGVAALLDAKHGGGLNAGQLKSALKESADDVGMPGADNLFGHGRVNADAATEY